MPLPPLRHEADLSKLHRRRTDLLRIEKEKKGHYTMDELKAIGDRPEIELQNSRVVWIVAASILAYE